MSVQRYKDVTFVIGPPGPEDMYQRLIDLSQISCRSFDEVYRDFIYENILGDENNNRNLFDEILSNMLEKQVHTNYVFKTYYTQRRTKESEYRRMFDGNELESVLLPAFTLYPPKFTDETGKSIETQITSDIMKAISNSLGYILQSECVVMIAT